MSPGSAAESDNMRIRVLFLAWGFSIHAQRRIQVFTEDPQFDVTVVSTFEYEFPGATVIPLSRAQRETLSKYSGGSEGSVTSPPGIRHISSPFRLLSKCFLEIHDLIRDILILKKTVKKIHPDLIFLQTLLYPSYLVFFIERSIPVIITFWNGDVTWWAKWTGIERLLKKYIVLYGVRRAAEISVNSKTAAEACRGYGKSPDKIHIIRYPGVDRKLFFPINKQVARHHIGENSTRIVLWPRGTGDYLNFDILISASESIIKKYPDIRFIVLFPNKAIDHSLVDTLRNKGIEKNFLLLEKVQFHDMPYYYSAADMMVSISSNDSLPNTMLEAMACGCPVVMGDIPQIREWVVHGKNGYLCPVRDAGRLAVLIQRVLEDPDHINAQFIRENCALIAHEFDSAAMGERIKALVRETYSAPCRSPP